MRMMCSPISALGKLIVFTIQSYVERLLSSGRIVPTPLSLFIDEAQLMLYQGVDNLFSRAGDANVWVHGFCQSAAQMYDVVGQDYAKTILDTTNTKLLMRVVDSETVEYVADLKPHDVMGLKAREFYVLTYSGLYKGRSLDVNPPIANVQFPSELRA
jgi:type IV secretory pathway TraG/TraD family ATPase VirD4